MITDREKIVTIVDNDCFTKADVAVLLEGDGYNRYKKAVELYKSGLVSKIVFSGNIVDKKYGSYPYEEIKPMLIEAGVRERDIMHEDKALNTREQAVEIVRMAKSEGWNKIALVASAEHQYRAYLTFLREVVDTKSKLIIYNTPARELSWFKDEGWGDRYHRLDAEFDRIEKYTELGHLANVEEVIEYQKKKESLLDE